jgi:hypothetical protein
VITATNFSTLAVVKAYIFNKKSMVRTSSRNTIEL